MGGLEEEVAIGDLIKMRFDKAYKADEATKCTSTERKRENKDDNGHRMKETKEEWSELERYLKNKVP